ncbi:hypothetical protein STENM36S_00691 [Streptomyces tendae]
MSMAERKALCLEMVAAWNRWDLNGIIKHWSPDIVHYSEDNEVGSADMIKLMEGGSRRSPTSSSRSRASWPRRTG